MMVDRQLKSKYKFFRLLTIAIFTLLTVRLAALQLVDAPVYRTRAALNQFRFLPIRALRGDIVDRNGKVLAANKIVNTVSIVRQQTDSSDFNRTVKNLAALLHDVYPEVNEAYIEKQLGEHQTRSYEPVVIKRDVTMDVVSRLEERRRDLPGVVIGKEIVRYYPENTLASHTLGHIGEISQEELERYREEKKYTLGDLIGRFGLEAQYEEYLRGENGFHQVEVDVSGRPIPNKDLITVSPKQGDRLVLTLDYDLQQVLEESMDQALADMNKRGLKAEAGAAVVLDVRTGGVLATASRPNFDPNRLVPPVTGAAVKEYLNPPSGTEPTMLNRAISSRYPPGSTFKPITGMAALESGQLTSEDTVVCHGAWPNPRVSCGAAHGTMNLFRAMAVSCNVFFIEAGRRAGAEMITKVAHEFGLDEKTGIDLPGEIAGNFLSPAEKKAKNAPVWEKWRQDEQAKIDKKYDALLFQAKNAGERSRVLAQKKDAERQLEAEYKIKYNFYVNWQPFETYFMAFGQGSSEYTPIGLANYAATLANGGNRMRPYLVKRIEDRNGKVVASFGPEVVRRVDVSDETMEQIRQAMMRVAAPGGTASGIFGNFPVKVAAKTGTAESGRGDNLYHGVFIAFAPADNPEIAFAGIFESGYHGSTSMGPVAKDVFAEYFGLNKDVSQGAQKGTDTAPATKPSTKPETPRQTTPDGQPDVDLNPPEPQPDDNTVSPGEPGEVQPPGGEPPDTGEQPGDT